jgi:hypothetical protein
LLSALNAFNPVPGLGLALDVGMLLDLSREVIEIYGLTDEQLDFETQTDWKHEAWGTASKRRTILAVKKFVSQEAIVPLLIRLLPGLEAQAIARWVPFVGQAVASVMGYRLTAAYAQTVIDTCEAQALSIIRRD